MIKSSAMLHEGKIYTGKRHGDCIKSAVEDTGVTPVKGDGGFIAEIRSGGQVFEVFMDREEAARYVKTTGQRKRCTGGVDRLYSEDLW